MVGSSTSRQWGGFKNPRIVRVSRSFGGKDRHSKVCTIRGLRDRRIRLSVPTAIQLYDLQDRLGLSQPSKVVDWLLDATKMEIDKLPPLHFPPAPPNSFSVFDHPSSLSLPPPPHHFPHHHETAGELKPHHTGKEKWIIEESQDAGAGPGVIAAAAAFNNGVNVVPQNFFPLGSPSSFSAAALINNNNNSSSACTLPPYNSYYHWEPSSLSLAQFHDSQNNNNNNNPNLYFPSIFPPPYMAATPPEAAADPRHLTAHFHHLLTTSSTSSPQHHSHHHLIQNPLLPPTLHFIKSPYAKDLSSLPDNNNNPEKSSRGS